MRLSILLITYNSRHFIADCLKSIRAHAPPMTETILVDNCSCDGTVEVVAERFPWVQVVRSARNVGFAGANNLAGRVARGRAVLLLNPDTILLESIEPALEALEDDPNIGALTIKALDADGRYQPCVGRFPTALRLIKIAALFSRIPDDGSPREVDWVQGSFLLTTRENWLALGGLDDQFFMYVEDVDFCRRTKGRGAKVMFFPSVRYTHLGGFESTRFGDLITGMRRYVDLHLSGFHWLAARCVLLTGCAYRLARESFCAMLRPEPGRWAVVRALARACVRLML